jgi:hypothetical protein
VGASFGLDVRGDGGLADVVLVRHLGLVLVGRQPALDLAGAAVVSQEATKLPNASRISSGRMVSSTVVVPVLFDVT